MKINKKEVGIGLKLTISVFLPVLFLNFLSQTNFINNIYSVLFVVAVVFTSWLLRSEPSSNGKINYGNQILMLISSILFLGICIHYDEEIFGWLFLFAFYTLLILISEGLSNQSSWLKWFGRTILTASSGIVPILLNQILIRFSEEEFYTALFVLFFSIFWFLLWICYHTFVRKLPLKSKLKVFPFFSFSPKAAILLITIALFSFLIYASMAYQKSFYPENIEATFAEISEKDPFICETLTNQEQSEIITGLIVQERYANNIANKADLKTLDYGFLATYYQTDAYLSSFKEHLLLDAKSGFYTTPPGSVKWDQWEASQVLYYYLKIKELKPDLFDSQETHVLENWIFEINSRAQKVGWVDWMYGLAFSHKPIGAYLNQDIGAGLYAILNQFPFLDEALYSRNSNFLEQNDRGWVNNFRVTDDAISYQPVWITNSYFQSLLTGETNKINQSLSFEWIKAQALPNGDLQTYNFPGKISVAPITLFGATLLEDEALLWISNKSMDTLGNTYGLPVQIGTEKEISKNLAATTPDLGACLLYGDSGLPEQKGPLAPDKIVFRNGWLEDDLYISLNLRFTGWHRYKASNSISLIYAGTPLVEEQHTQESISWLPAGRALVRDKRIPIEQLNTLLIPRTGLDAVLNTLVSIFGPYAQDPPFYAKVLTFETSESYDYSTTQIKDWHGWTFNRSIHFFQDGPVFIIDDATSNKSHSAKINWHFNPDYQLDKDRVEMPNGNVNFLLVGQEEGSITQVRKDSELVVEYESPKTGELNLLTIILPGPQKNARFLEYSGNVISLEVDGIITNYELKP